jgi:hypothetical protein
MAYMSSGAPLPTGQGPRTWVLRRSRELPIGPGEEPGADTAAGSQSPEATMPPPN